MRRRPNERTDSPRRRSSGRTGESTRGAGDVAKRGAVHCSHTCSGFITLARRSLPRSVCGGDGGQAFPCLRGYCACAEEREEPGRVEKQVARTFQGVGGADLLSGLCRGHVDQLSGTVPSTLGLLHTSHVTSSAGQAMSTWMIRTREGRYARR
jgi:hypothetical protein